MRKKKEKVEKQKVQNQEEKNKIGIKEKVKRFLKNKKAVAMLMEYIITIECFAMLFLLVAPEEVKAATSQADENGITWAYTLSNGQATNVYYKRGTLGETVTIPATISDGTNEYPVTSLHNSSRNNYIFFNSYTADRTVKKVIIPDSVTSIGNYAFEDCSALTSLEIPSSVTSIGNYAFDGCSSLTSIEIPSSVTSIGKNAFCECRSVTSLTVNENNPNYSSENDILYNKDKTELIQCAGGKTGEVIIPSSVTSVGEKAFSSCSSLTSVVIQEGVTSIESYAFSGCSSLTSVNIAEGVTSIGRDAFSNCSSLTSIEIPSSVTRIGIDAFLCCSSLTSLIVDENNPNYSSENDILYNKDKTELIQCAGGKTGEVVIPSSVTSIVRMAFYDCSSLTSIEIPAGVTSVGYRTFYNCSSLTSVEIPSSVTSIGEAAFSNCSSLTSIEIPSSVTSIGWDAFSDCSSLTSVVIQEGVTSIGRDAFSNCSSLTSVDIPSSVTSIDDRAFSNCSSLTSVVIPSSVTNEIGERAFYGCSSLKSVEILSNVTSGNEAFRDCDNLSDIYAYQCLTKWSSSHWNRGINAHIHYKNCKHTIRKKIVEAGLQIEEVSNNLANGEIVCGETYQFKVIDENGNIPTGIKVRVTSQGEFTNSAEVTEVIKPNEEGIYTIEKIERNKTINIEKIVNGDTFQTTDENGITWEYKYEDGKARALKYISGEIPETLEVPASIDGLIVTTMADGALQGTSAKNVILPDSIINIGQHAFENCTNLETIVLPEGLQLISNSAFKGCSNLRQVELPDDLLAIGNEAFSGCTSLKMNLNFKEGIRVIGKESFKNCTSLTGKLTLPESTIQVGTGAFKDCTGITKVEILSYTGEKEIDQSQVNLISSTWAGNIWINENGTEYNLSRYSSMTGISENTITNNVVDEYGNCVKDEYGNNVTESFIITKRDIYIGLESFSGCSSLTEIHLPAGTNKVAYSTIEGCDNLRDIYIATKKSDMLEEVNTNGEVNVHYLDCSHTVEVSAIEGTNIEVIAGEAEEGLAACEQDYKFKVNIEEGSTLKGVVVKVGNKGEEKEAIKADKNGIYCIENVTKDKEISIEEGRIVEIRYEDKEGKQIAKSDILVGQEGENYKAERKEIENYRSYGTEPENAEGVFTTEEIIVTYKYEKIPSGIITIKYQDKEGNNIIDPETKQGYVGDAYEIARKNIKGYKAYGVSPEKAKGTYTAEDIEIIFVYEEIKEEETVIKYIDKEGNYIARDKTIQEGEEANTEAKEIEGYENVEKTEEGKEITYTYEKVDKTGQANKWTTEKTLLTIAGLIAMLIVIFIIIAKREKEVEMNGKKYRTIEEALEAIKENKQEEEKVEIKLLKDIEREGKIEGLEDETIKIDYNGYEIKIKE